MSFDLYAFVSVELPDDTEARATLLDDECWGAPLHPELADFVAELEQRYPGLDVEPDGSPWSSWPLTQSVAGGRGCAFNIRWSHCEAMSADFKTMCAARRLAIYDPQDDAVIRPSPPKRQWWRR